MPAIDTIVQVTISAATTTPSRTGFGTPLIAGYHDKWPERVRSYSSVSEMTAVDWASDTNHPIIRAAQHIFGQNPAPPTIKVGRRASAMSQAGRFTPTVTTEGVINSVNVVSPDGTVTAVSYTNGSSETIATICAALQPLLNAITDLTAVDNTTHVSWSADTAGDLFDFASISASLEFLDETTDPGIAADLTAIDTEDSDWYALCLDSNSKAEVAAAAAWIESRVKIFGCNTADAEVLDDTAGNIMETLESNNYARTFCVFSGDCLSYAAAAALGKNLPKDPGSITWSFKELAQVVADELTTTELGNIESNNGNHFTEVAGIDMMRWGTMADGEYIDIQRTIDALTARIQEDMLGLIAGLDKLPYTNKGIAAAESTLRGSIRAFQETGALDDSVDPTISVPDVADISTANKANRILPDIEFDARLAGAIHKVEIEGVLTL